MSLQPSMNLEKEIGRLITRLQLMIASKRLPLAYLRMLPYFLIGLLRVKFSPLWKTVKGALGALATHMDVAVFWPTMLSALKQGMAQSMDYVVF